MGICTSCDGAAVPAATAKLILPDGTLREYSCPVKASCVLHKDPSFFICNSDEMGFDGVVSAVHADAELQPCQIYFALPLNRLGRRLEPEEMAALAVKASAALVKSGVAEYTYVCNRRKVESPAEIKGSKGTHRGGRGRSGRRWRVFTAELGPIPE